MHPYMAVEVQWSSAGPENDSVPTYDNSIGLAVKGQVRRHRKHNKHKAAYWPG